MEKALLVGPFIGEFGWEILRFAPHIIWNKRIKYRDAKIIVLTRADRFDLYGRYASILIDLKIKGDFVEKQGNCYGLENFSNEEYEKIARDFRAKYIQQYEIVDHIYPKNPKCQRGMYKPDERFYMFAPREENKRLIKTFIDNKKKNVILAPRFRKGYARNWQHWNTLFDMIHNDDDLKKYNFIICGKDPEYIHDVKNRFYDIGDIDLTNQSSLAGVTMNLLKSSILTVGSQSAIPNLSNLLSTPTLQWGHEKTLHEELYNIKKTTTTFLESKDKKQFDDIKPEIVFKTMKNLLKKEEKENNE